ncbi:UbiA prenyltransferase family protein [Thermopirellula anaerolimosa]
MTKAAVPHRGPLWLDVLRLARPEYWFKNGFMLLGVLLAVFYRRQTTGEWPTGLDAWLQVVLGFAAVCLIASSNYALNEWCDLESDRYHPEKRGRPLAAGRLPAWSAAVLWTVLAAAGLCLAMTINRPFTASAWALWWMGVLYNVRPVRTKDWPYIDVLTESVNNPLRLFLGWFTVMPDRVPPLSLILAYWMAGAFFMAAKRLAEKRSLGPGETAGRYRPSLGRYRENDLLIQMFFYASAASLLLGVFIVRYHVELILAVPLVAGVFAAYLRLTLAPGSAAQQPERLYRERWLMAYLAVCLVVFTVLMFVEWPWLRSLINVDASGVPSIWQL